MLPSLAVCHPPAQASARHLRMLQLHPPCNVWMWPRDGRVRLQGCAPTVGLSHRWGGSGVSPSTWASVTKSVALTALLSYPGLPCGLNL